ncbi:HNH endonuclease [Rhizobium sp. LC145]|uniref:HNH endonuclease n=1 Tax=Rhizobium sp. LC145 TaxID=1120688 RepID=UPI00062A0E90|nr:HNH endonuclease [Rhizobium sp. LC145]KKX25303.1 hypothetical protein YH62_25480 [Rhizobium sp. LC145]TKT45325.1 HNH endonuclease [Rhizobiaceae bacterium LC148]
MAECEIIAPRDLTQSKLKEALEYDPATGEFRWLQTNSHRRIAGMDAGGLGVHGYWRVSVYGHRYYAHRLAWFYMTGEWPKQHIDHVNLDKRDNRFANLRLATPPQNNVNTGLKVSNSSGFVGVNFDRRSGKWLARVRANGKRVNLGLFETAEAAARARDAYAMRNHGEFFRAAIQ